MLPKFARAVRDGLRGEEIDLSNQGLGDQQFTALLSDSDLLPASRITRWRLRDLRLSNAGVAALAAVVPPHTEMLDLARNEISLGGGEALGARMMQDHLTNLRRLDLSVNGLRNDATARLCEGLAHCPLLIRLDLNHNVIQDGTALGKFVGEHPHLMRLSLHCNFLSGNGVAALFRGALRNSQAGGRLADVDVAWNGIADNGKAAMLAAEAIAAVLKVSVTLFHLDLSYNRMDGPCCAKIGEGLRDNHFLYGLHIVGNYATIDADGFLCPIIEDPDQPVGIGSAFGDPRTSDARCGANRQSSQALAKQVERSADGVDDLRERDVLEHQTSCWACEGWERIELEWPVSPDEPEPRAVWAFTSLDGFKTGLRLRKAADGLSFSIARMVPPKCRLQVIFQVDSALRVPPGHVENLVPAVNIELRACEELSDLSPPPDQVVVAHRQKTGPKGVVEHSIVLNFWQAVVVGTNRALPPTESVPSGRRVVLLDGAQGAGPVQMPRITETEYRMTSKKARGKTFFSGFERDDDKMLRKCLETDWSRAKISRIVPEVEREDVQLLLQAHYKRITAIYRILSADGVTGESGMGVSQLALADTMIGAGLGDDEVTRISDLDRLFISAKVMPMEMKQAQLAVRSDKSLVRYQFLEFLLRLASQRYVQTGAAQTMVDAVGRVLDALGPLGSARAADLEAFFHALHTEAVDDVYQRNLDVLQAVFQKYSGRLTPPGQTKFMSLIEFQDLMEAISAYDKEFTSKRSAIAFRMGLMTQADESFSSRFQEMTFVEFQHAVGAIVFLRSGFSPSDTPAIVDEFIASHLMRVVIKRKGSKCAA